jgi:hypothetical protein
MSQVAAEHETEAEAEEEKEEEEEEESLHDTVGEKLDTIFEGVSDTISETRQGALNGLATGKGRSTTDESEGAYTLDEEGNTLGVQKLTQKGGAVGVGHHSQTDKGSIKGTAKKTDETELEGLAGAQWAAAFVTNADPKKLEAGVDLLAKAGAFGTARKKLAYRNGRFNAQMEAKGSGGAGVEGSLKAGATATKTNIPIVDKAFISELEAAIQIAVKVGFWVDGEFNASASYGPVTASAFAKASALIGAELKMSGRAWIGLKEAGVEWEAEAFAGAKVTGEAGASVKVGPAELEAKVEGEAMAGAEAKTSGNFKIGVKGVSAKVQAEAFAGAKAKVTGTAGFKIRGRTIVSVSGEVEVSAGAGGKVKGEFTLENGVMKFGAELSAALGLGAGAGFDAMIDAGALATIIAADLRELAGSEGPVKAKSPNFKREAITDETKAEAIRQIGYNAVLEEFQLYAAKKGEEGKNVVKKEKVQQIIKDAAIFNADKLKYVEYDEGMKQAAYEAFRGQVTYIDIQAGTIRGWDVVKGEDVAKFKASSAAFAAQEKAKEKLKTDLTSYGTKKVADKKKTPLAKAEVQEIIAKHLPALRSAYNVTDTFSGESANAPIDQAVLEASDELQAQWFNGFGVHQGGLIKRFEARTHDEVLKEAQDEKDDTARDTALAAMGKALTEYKAKVIADEKITAPDLAVIQKHYDAAAKKAPTAFGTAKGNAASIAQITESLSGLVSGVTVGGGRVTFRNVEGGIQKARGDAKKATTDAARSQAVDSFKANLTAYKEKMVAGGGFQLIGKPKISIEAKEVERVLGLAMKLVPGWASWTVEEKDEFDLSLTTAAQEAFGDILKYINIGGGALHVLDVDNAKLVSMKDDRKLNGTKVLTGGQEQDNDRRKLVADLVVPGLQKYGEQLKATGAKKPASSEAMPTEAGLAKRINDGMKTVRADLIGSPVADEELTWHLKDLFKMITDVEVKNMAITRIGVNPSYFSQKNEQKAVDGIVMDTLLPFVEAQLGTERDLRRAQVQSLVYKAYAKVQGQPGHIVDKAMVQVIGISLRDTVQEITIKDGVIQKFVEKKKTP